MSCNRCASIHQGQIAGTDNRPCLCSCHIKTQTGYMGKLRHQKL